MAICRAERACYLQEGTNEWQSRNRVYVGTYLFCQTGGWPLPLNTACMACMRRWTGWRGRRHSCHWHRSWVCSLALLPAVLPGSLASFTPGDALLLGLPLHLPGNLVASGMPLLASVWREHTCKELRTGAQL